MRSHRNGTVTALWRECNNPCSAACFFGRVPVSDTVVLAPARRRGAAGRGRYRGAISGRSPLAPPGAGDPSLRRPGAGSPTDPAAVDGESPDGAFRVTASDGAARAGVLTTAHGDVRDARLHARRDEGDRQVADARRGARARRADRARQHLPPPLPARRRADRRARRAAPLHGLGRADPHRLRRLPGLLAARHAARRRRRRRHLPQRLRRRRDPLHARARRRDPAQPRQRHRDVPRPGPAGGGRPTRARRCRAPHDRVGPPPAPRGACRRGSSASRSARAAPTRSSAGARSRSSLELDFDGNAIGGLAIGEDRGRMFETTDCAAALLPEERRATSWASATPKGSSR